MRQVLTQQSTVSMHFTWAWVSFIGFSMWAVSLTSVWLLTYCKLHTFLACSAGHALARRINEPQPKTSWVKGSEQKLVHLLHWLYDWFAFFTSNLLSWQSKIFTGGMPTCYACNMLVCAIAPTPVLWHAVMWWRWYAWTRTSLFAHRERYLYFFVFKRSKIF